MFSSAQMPFSIQPTRTAFLRHQAAECAAERQFEQIIQSSALQEDEKIPHPRTSCKISYVGHKTHLKKPAVHTLLLFLTRLET